MNNVGGFLGQFILIGLAKLIIYGLASMVRWRKLAEYKEEEEDHNEEGKHLDFNKKESKDKTLTDEQKEKLRLKKIEKEE